MGNAIKDARSRLIECGRQLIIRDGYDHMRIQDVTSGCGMATGTFYSYFDSKGSFFQSVFEEDWQAAMARLDQQLNGMQGLRECLKEVYQALEDIHQVYFRSLIEMGIDPDNHDINRRIFVRLFADLSDRVSRSLCSAEDSGQITLNGKASLADVSAMIVENLLAISRNDSLDEDKFIEMLLEWLAVPPAESGEEISDRELQRLIRVTPGKKAFYRLHDGRAEALYLSPALFDYLGISEQKAREVAEHDSLDMVMPEDRPGLINIIHACVTTGQPFHYCWRIRHENREPGWVQADGCLAGTRDGDPVISIVYNSLASENDIYQTLIDGTQTKIYVCDSVTYEILYENKSAAESNADQWRTDGQMCYQVIRGKQKPCEDCFLYGRTEGGMFQQVRYNPYTKAWEQLSGKYVN